MKTRRYLLLVAFLVFAAQAHADPITGYMHLYSPFTSSDLCTRDPVPCGWVSGAYDGSTGTLSFNPIDFIITPLFVNAVQLLPEGTSELDDGFGGFYTVTVSPGQLGAYMEVIWPIVGATMPTVMVWDLNTSGPPSPAFIPVDSDGDGIPGHAWPSNGPFISGGTLIFELWYGEPPPPQPPGITITIDVAGGNDQECNSHGGNTVAITADVTLTGGAVLDSINWLVDGEPAGSGTFITPTLAVGSHQVSATAETTTGETDTDLTTLSIHDFTAPVLDVAFLDARSGETVSQIDTANVEWIAAHFVATDACDPDPLVSDGMLGTTINNDEILKIQGNNNTVMLMLSTLVLEASAEDASGNTSEGSATLVISD